MKCVTVEPDKVRFINPNTDKYGIHIVEFSDDRSVGHFVSFYTKSDPECFSAGKGMQQTPHNPEMFHRLADGQDEGDRWRWLLDIYKSKNSIDHRQHFHVGLERSPTVKDLEDLDLPIDPDFLTFIKEHHA